MNEVSLVGIRGRGGESGKLTIPYQNEFRSCGNGNIMLPDLSCFYFSTSVGDSEFSFVFVLHEGRWVEIYCL